MNLEKSFINPDWHTPRKKVDEVNIAQVELYRFSDLEIATDINDEFGEFWGNWIEDAYEMQLTPEQTLFRYNNKYFSFSVFIYGVKGDATELKGTVVNYWFKDYTKQVNEYIKCKKQGARHLSNKDKDDNR